MAAAKSKDYPRTLYKKNADGKCSFTNKTNRGIRYDSLIVNTKEEKETAETELGYIDSFEDALFPKGPEKDEIENGEEY